ncbi:MAG: hypothetical protein M1436_08410, partial [Acidobacteria bacterium]|nr:hypothetical protein [Acidobacteriota bacterium]
MTRYTPARHYRIFGIVALALAGFSARLGMEWTPAFVPAVLFVLSSLLLLMLGFRPPIAIPEAYRAVGKR